MTLTSALDVRTIEPLYRHATIFSRLGELGVGDSLVLLVDHDPKPLRAQLEAREGDKVQWTYLEQGPQQWQVQVTRTKGHSQCCGSCGG